MARTATRTKHATIKNLDDIQAGCRALSQQCRTMRAIHRTAGDPPLRRHPAGFGGLARIIVGQQLSIASAGAIWNRFNSAAKPMSAQTILAMPYDALRATGLSRPKIKTLRSLSTAMNEGALNLSKLRTAPEDEVKTKLTSISGIGPWTADIYLMFCLGRSDAFAPGDLALQEAVRLAGLSENRPAPDEVLDIAERWRPWRGVAARLLWVYYAQARQAKSPPGKSPL